MRKRHERELLVLVLLTLIAVGGGLIGLIFGWEAMLGALPCLLAGGGAILVLYVLLWFAERWVERQD
jgi:hypothetical protein